MTIAIRDSDRDREHPIDQGDTRDGEIARAGAVQTRVAQCRAGVNAVGPCVIARVVWI